MSDRGRVPVAEQRVVLCSGCYGCTECVSEFPGESSDKLALLHALQAATPEQLQAVLDHVGGRYPSVSIAARLMGGDRHPCVTVRQDGRSSGLAPTFAEALKGAQQ